MTARPPAPKAPPLPAASQLPSTPVGHAKLDVLWAGLIAVSFCVLYQLVYGHYNLNMRDEGYLWYGVQQVLRGDVPLRDFQSYDPGRYYWCSWLSPIFGSGIVGVRAALVSFSAIGLFAGLLVARRFVPSRSWLVPVAGLLMLSMFPRHKLFEPAVVLIAVWTTTRLIERPSTGRTLLAGIVVGLAAVFGRNHGLYLAIAYCGLFLLTLSKGLDTRPWRSAGVLTLGVILGYSPVLVMLVWVPGFQQAFVDALLSVKTVGSNIEQPYLWPWTPPPENDLLIANPHWLIPYGKLALRGAYLLPVLLLPTGGWLLLRRNADWIRAHAGLVSAALIGLPYAYHYAVRSDVPHLFQAIQPVLLTGLGLAALAQHQRRSMAAVLGTLLGGMLLVAFTEHPELKHAIDSGHAQERITLEVQGDTLSLPQQLGIDIEMVQKAVAKALPEDEEIFILPTMPTYYPILGKASPSWWIYMLWRNSKEEQLEIIADLKAHDISTIIKIARPFNRDPAFNLIETNPLLWKYILANFTMITNTPELPMPQRINLWIRNDKI